MGRAFQFSQALSKDHGSQHAKNRSAGETEGDEKQ
jgi:hypothetical protein